MLSYRKSLGHKTSVKSLLQTPSHYSFHLSVNGRRRVNSYCFPWKPTKLIPKSNCSWIISLLVTCPGFLSISSAYYLAEATLPKSCWEQHLCEVSPHAVPLLWWGCGSLTPPCDISEMLDGNGWDLILSPVNGKPKYPVWVRVISSRCI